MMVELDERSNTHDAMHAVRARLHAFMTRRVETPEAADDLTQEVLLRLLQHNHGQIANPTAWLYQVARNVIIDHYRTRHSRHRLVLDEQAQPELADDPFADDPQEAQRELAGCLRSLIDQLAEPYRSAVIAVDLHGKTQTDAAQTAGLSISGMKSRVQRGRRQLHQLLIDCCHVHTGPAGDISGYQPIAGCEPNPCGAASVRCTPTGRGRRHGHDRR
jgi:RNA polymerase sigma-70 factor (ECF subfamily)